MYKISLDEIKVRIKNVLTNLFKNTRICGELAKDKELHRILQVVLSIYLTIESRSESTISSKEFIHKFNDVAQTNYVISNIADIADSDKIIDELNWLNTYCKNRYNIDLVNNSFFNTDDGAVSMTDRSDNDDKNSAVLNYVNQNQDKLDQLYKTAATAVKSFQSDIVKGKIYLNDSKPRIIPVLKKIFVVSNSFLALLFSVYLALELVQAVNLNTSATWVNFAFILLFILMVIVLLVRISKSIWSTWTKNNKNNLSEYYFFSSLTSCMSVYGVLLVACFIRLLEKEDNATTFVLTEWLKEDGALGVALFAFWIAIMAVIVFNIMILVLGFVKNPQRDEKRLAQLSKQYYEKVVELDEKSPNDRKPKVD